MIHREPCYYLPWLRTDALSSEVWLHNVTGGTREEATVTWHDRRGRVVSEAIAKAEPDAPCVLPAPVSGYGLVTVRGDVRSDLLCVLRHRNGLVTMTHGRGEWLERWPAVGRLAAALPVRAKEQHAAWPAHTSLFLLNLSNLAQVAFVGARPVMLAPHGAAIVPMRARRQVVRYAGRVNWFLLTHGTEGRAAIQHVK